ncbi:MAG TPA: hypothetical protein VFG12_11600 [Rhodopila sp.]|jgi:hypothetical protein|nr:hypothetical protein [Rhodopila sp.]
MQPLRRWVPARLPAAPEQPSLDALLQDIAPQDIEFCAALQANGGVAAAEDGFQAEAELLRLRRAGLLDLQRDQTPPFAITRVALSQKARDLVQIAARTKAPDRSAKPPAAAPEQQHSWMLRRSGFEVARGMLNAAVKSEFAAWKKEGGPGGYAALETRILTRIGDVKVPFRA